MAEKEAMTGIDKASVLAAAVSAINAQEFGALDDIQMDVTVEIYNSKGAIKKSHANVRITRRRLIRGDVVTRIIQTAKSLGATEVGIEPTGGIYAHFTDS